MLSGSAAAPSLCRLQVRSPGMPCRGSPSPCIRMPSATLAPPGTGCAPAAGELMQLASPLVVGRGVASETEMDMTCGRLSPLPGDRALASDAEMRALGSAAVSTTAGSTTEPESDREGAPLSGASLQLTRTARREKRDGLRSLLESLRRENAMLRELVQEKRLRRQQREELEEENALLHQQAAFLAPAEPDPAAARPRRTGAGAGASTPEVPRTLSAAVSHLSPFDATLSSLATPIRPLELSPQSTRVFDVSGLSPEVTEAQCNSQVLASTQSPHSQRGAGAMQYSAGMQQAKALQYADVHVHQHAAAAGEPDRRQAGEQQAGLAARRGRGTAAAACAVSLLAVF